MRENTEKSQKQITWGSRKFRVTYPPDTQSESDDTRGNHGRVKPSRPDVKIPAALGSGLALLGVAKSAKPAFAAPVPKDSQDKQTAIIRQTTIAPVTGIAFDRFQTSDNPPLSIRDPQNPFSITKDAPAAQPTREIIHTDIPTLVKNNNINTPGMTSLAQAFVIASQTGETGQNSMFYAWQNALVTEGVDASSVKSGDVATLVETELKNGNFVQIDNPTVTDLPRGTQLVTTDAQGKSSMAMLLGTSTDTYVVSLSGTIETYNDFIKTTGNHPVTAVVEVNDITQVISNKTQTTPPPAPKPPVPPASQQTTPEQSAANGQYVVVRNDTLTELAKRFGVTVDEIVAANNLKNPNLILPGETLRIPRTNPSYVVQPGDTVSAIAATEGSSVQAVAAANSLADPNFIRPGEILRIPVNRPAATNTVSQTTSTTGAAAFESVPTRPTTPETGQEQNPAKAEILAMWKGIPNLGDTPDGRLTNLARVTFAMYPHNRAMAEFVFAQGVLESGIAQQGPNNELTDVNNLWGVKGNGPTGESILVPTTEYVSGQYVYINARFAKYDTLYAALAAHDSLLHASRYSHIWTQTTVEGIAQQIKAAGYATDPEYVQKIVSTWDNFQSNFDQQVNVLNFLTAGRSLADAFDTYNNGTTVYNPDTYNTIYQTLLKDGYSQQTVEAFKSRLRQYALQKEGTDASGQPIQAFECEGYAELSQLLFAGGETVDLLSTAAQGVSMQAIKAGGYTFDRLGTGLLDAGDIAYTTKGGAGHVVIILARNPDGSYMTMEANQNDHYNIGVFTRSQQDMNQYTGFRVQP